MIAKISKTDSLGGVLYCFLQSSQRYIPPPPPPPPSKIFKLPQNIYFFTTVQRKILERHLIWLFSMIYAYTKFSGFDFVLLHIVLQEAGIMN